VSANPIGAPDLQALEQPAPRYECRPLGVFDRELGVELVPGAEGWERYEEDLRRGARVDPAPAARDPRTLEELVADRCADVEVIAADLRARIVAPASPAEMASWTEKLRQARAFDASALDGDAPMLALEAQVRGLSTSDIVARVLRNADGYQRAEAAIAGASGRHRDALRALQRVADVLAYDIFAGWPMNVGPAAAPISAAAPA
jgi:hypothetical protein